MHLDRRSDGDKRDPLGASRVVSQCGVENMAISFLSHVRGLLMMLLMKQ